MKRIPQRLAVLVAATLSLSLFAPARAADAGAAQQLQIALAAMHEWLAAEEHGSLWRDYLMSDQLVTELAKGPEADLDALARIRAAYSDTTPGLDRPQFAAVRAALDAWLAELKNTPKDLAREARASKAAFTPITPADVALARQELAAALATADARLAVSGEIGRAWSKFLNWQNLKDLVASDSPDFAALTDCETKLQRALDQPGGRAFADVRAALVSYVALARAAADPELKTACEQLLERLAQLWEIAGDQPSPGTAGQIAAAVAWLEHVHQAPDLVAEIRRRYSAPNLHLEISAGLVERALAGPFTQTDPVSDVILGTRIHGTSQTAGRSTVRLVPAAERAVVDLLVEATSSAATVGYHDPVQVHSDSTTAIRAAKRMFIEDKGLSATPAVAQASTDTTIRSIRSSRNSPRVQQEAWSRARQEQPSSEAIAARRAEARTTTRMDADARKSLAEANDALADWRMRLDKYCLNPPTLDWSTTSTAVALESTHAAAGQMAARTAAPPLDVPADLSLRLHESFLNNAAIQRWAGRELAPEALQEIWTDLFESEAPARLATPAGEEPLTIVLHPQHPLTVRFADDRVTLTIHGWRYRKGAEEYPAMDLIATYQIAPAAGGLRAVLAGKPQAFPPGFDPGGVRRLSVRQQVLRTLIERRLVPMFDETIIRGPLVPSADWRRIGELALVECRATDGWLVLAWDGPETTRPVPAGIPTDGGKPPADSAALAK